MKSVGACAEEVGSVTIFNGRWDSQKWKRQKLIRKKSPKPNKKIT